MTFLAHLGLFVFVVVFFVAFGAALIYCADRWGVRLLEHAERHRRDLDS